jgi:[protein-PII] uridylyltransferase
LRELFQRTHTFFDRGERDGAEIDRLIAKRKARVAELLGEQESGLSDWFASLDERYIIATAPRDMVAHLRLSRRRRGILAMDVAHQPRKSVSELTVCADDVPGLLAKIAGVFLANRIDVLSAQINSRALADGRSEALDVFLLRDRYGRAITDDGRWAQVETDLAAILGGALAVEQLIAQRREKSGLPERKRPAVRTEIEVDNEVSRDFSVIDVYTQDRLGVLHAITQTLAALRLDIHLSKVATEADRVADVFYVREETGGKLSLERVDEVTLALSEALGRLQAESP